MSNAAEHVNIYSIQVHYNNFIVQFYCSILYFYIPLLISILRVTQYIFSGRLFAPCLILTQKIHNQN